MKIWLKNLDISNHDLILNIKESWNYNKTIESNIFYTTMGIFILKHDKYYKIIPRIDNELLHNIISTESLKSIDNDKVIYDTTTWDISKTETYNIPPQSVFIKLKKIVYKRNNSNFDLVCEYNNNELYDIYFIPNKKTTLDNLLFCVTDFY